MYIRTPAPTHARQADERCRLDSFDLARYLDACPPPESCFAHTRARTYEYKEQDTDLQPRHGLPGCEVASATLQALHDCAPAHSSITLNCTLGDMAPTALGDTALCTHTRGPPCTLTPLQTDRKNGQADVDILDFPVRLMTCSFLFAGIIIAFCMTFFSFFNVPVFWYAVHPTFLYPLLCLHCCPSRCLGRWPVHRHVLSQLT